MSNHVHLVVQQKDGKLFDWVRDFKKFTSKKLLKIILENQQESRREYFKVEFLLDDLELMYRWFYHGFYFDESGGSQQTFNEFNFEPVFLGELISHISGDILLGMQEWLTLNS